MKNTKIEWCDHTLNLWHGCSKVHAGCDNCYAEATAKRWGRDIWGPDKPRLEVVSAWQFSAWQKLDEMEIEAYNQQTKRRVFVGSMMDIFEKPMPLVNKKGEPLPNDTGGLRAILFENIEDGMYENLQFLFLTKRPSNINKYIPHSWKGNPPENVMFGTSISDQETANILIPQLLEVRGKKFVSLEPQIGPVNFIYIPNSKGWGEGEAYLNPLQGLVWDNGGFNFTTIGEKIDWVIQGGESGNNRRPFILDWAYSMKEECKIANVPYFFKQIDKKQPIPEDLQIREFPE